MQNKSDNMQFRPNTTMETKYCPLNLTPDFPICYMQEDVWYSANAPITMLHFHNCVQIGYCSHGEGRSAIGNSLYSYSCDHVSIVPAKVQHHFSSYLNTSSSWKWLYLDPVTLLPNISPDMVRQLMLLLYDEKHTPPYMVGILTDPSLVTLIRSIITEMEEQQEGYKEIVRSYVYILMLMLMRTVNHKDQAMIEPRTNLQIIEPAIQYISQHYMEPLTVEQLAVYCHLSVTHLRRMFHKIMNYSPLEYIQMVRLEAACVLLLRTDESILEIGLRCGFSTNTSFNRQFKKNFGTTPGRWRRDIQALKKSDQSSI